MAHRGLIPCHTSHLCFPPPFVIQSCKRHAKLTVAVGIGYGHDFLVGRGADDADEHSLVGAGSLHGLVQSLGLHVRGIVEGEEDCTTEVARKLRVESLLQVLLKRKIMS